MNCPATQHVQLAEALGMTIVLHAPDLSIQRRITKFLTLYLVGANRNNTWKELHVILVRILSAKSAWERDPLALTAEPELR